jgi:hypothetical protein
MSLSDLLNNTNLSNNSNLYSDNIITAGRISTDLTNNQVLTNSSYFRQTTASTAIGVSSIVYYSLINNTFADGRRILTINDLTKKIYKHVICGTFKIFDITTTTLFRINLGTTTLRLFTIAPLAGYLASTPFKLEIYISSDGIVDVNQLAINFNISLIAGALAPQISTVSVPLVVVPSSTFLINSDINFSTSNSANVAITSFVLLNEQ